MGKLMNRFFKRHLDALGVLLGAIFLVGLGFMAQRLLQWERPCLRFQGVIELHVDGYVEGVVQCGRTSRFQTQRLPEELNGFVSAINRLESTQALLPDHLRGVFVTITKKDPFFLLVSERSLVIGEEIARNEKALQRVILSAVAFQTFAGLETMGKELRADLLWYFFAGDQSWTDPTMGFEVEPTKWLKLAFAPQTVQEYCSSPIRQIYDLSFCRYELNKENKLSFRKSFQPLISWTAYRVLQELGGSQASHILRSLFQNWVSSGNVSLEPPIEGSEEFSLELAESFVRDEIRRLLIPMDSAEEEDLAFEDSQFDQEISQVWKPYQVSSSGSFDFIVEVEDSQLLDGVLNSLTEWQRNTLKGYGSRVLVVQGGDQLELPIATSTHYQMDHVRAHTHLVLACDLPALRRIAQFNSENLVALKVCDSSELPQWAEILSEGAGSHQTAVMRFDLHLPSLKRWSHHVPRELLASHLSLEEVFCRPEAFEGFPFSARHCTPSKH